MRFVAEVLLAVFRAATAISIGVAMLQPDFGGPYRLLALFVIVGVGGLTIAAEHASNATYQDFWGVSNDLFKLIPAVVGMQWSQSAPFAWAAFLCGLMAFLVAVVLILLGRDKTVRSGR